VVIVDYLQLMSSKGASKTGRRSQSQLLGGMKLMAKELGCPFLCFRS